MELPILYPAAAILAWIAWYKAVVQPASRKKGIHGPRWLSKILTDASYFVAGTLMQIPFKSNEKESEEKGILKGQIFVVFHPHGAFCGAATFFGGSMWFNHSTPKSQWYAMVADLLFRVPFLGDFLTINNVRSVSRSTIQGLLANGHSVAVQPGGIFEQIRWDPDREVIYFPKNLGFIYLAVERGIPLVPLYIFGENQLFGQNAITRKLNMMMNKLTGVGTLFVSGRFGLPILWPRPSPIYWCYGNRVEVGEPDASPSEERIHEIFRRYTKEIRRMFDAHAKEALPKEVAEKGLKIVWRGHEDVEL